MRKGIIIWIGILAALIATVILTSPVTDFYSLFFGNQDAKSCHGSVSCTELPRKCSVCGENWDVVHNNRFRVDCYTEKCKDCKAQFENEEHQKWCVSVDNCLSCGNDITAEKKKYPDYHRTIMIQKDLCITVEQCVVCNMQIQVHENHEPGNKLLVDFENCGVGVKCKWCNKVYTKQTHDIQQKTAQCITAGSCKYCDYQTILRTAHKWEVEECGESTYCSICGVYGGRARYPRHEYENKFLRVFDRCTKCGRMQIENSDFDWVARLAEVFGVLLVAFGFQYAIRKRKFMRINWLIVIFLWLEENTFFGNFTPAVLWKKKLD